MSYSAPYIDSDGIHVPTYEDIMEYLQEQYKTIFGLDSYLSPEMQDYQMMSVYAKCMEDCMALLIDVYNARNPAYATGVSLDAILSLSGMRRRTATYSSVHLKLSGIAGTVIPMGSKVVDDNGYLWSTQSDCELILIQSEDPAETRGEGYVLATCDSPGSIEAPVETINSIYRAIVGWSGVTNEESADIGLNTETDEEARMRRMFTLSKTGSGTYDALLSSLFKISGMKYADVVINDTSITDATTGIPAHTICPVVYAGANSEDDTEFKKAVAEAVWNGKSPGIGTYGGLSTDGGQTVQYTDSQGHVYDINFCIPHSLEVDVVITLETYDSYDAERVNAIIRQAIIEEINNLGIGKTWNVTTAYKDIYNAFSNEECPFAITSVTGQVDGGTAQTAKVVCPYNKFLTPGDITIVDSSEI